MPSELLLRRQFLKKASLMAGSALIASPLLFAASLKISEEEISPNEDLMREHGVLRRIILIYRESIQQIKDKKDIDPVLLTQSATIIKNFIEDYHEKLEENFLFPRFEKANKHMELVNTLKQQHQAGRKLTNSILEMTKSKKFKSNTQHIENVLSKFIYMYEPHAAREDTVLFPAFQTIVSSSEYKELGEQFEYEEHKLFGKEGFDGIVAQVADIEKTLNIYDLSKFTPS